METTDSRLDLEIRALKIASRMNLESGPQFAKVCNVVKLHK